MSYVNRGSVLAIGITFIPTSLLVVAARFFTRVSYGGGIGVDDWLALTALPFVLASSCVMIVGYTTHSLGTHSPPLGRGILTFIDPSYQTLKKLEYILYCLLLPALLFLKLSTLFFYKRIFRGRGFNIAFWFLSVFSIVWAITFFVAFAAACGAHVEYNWISIATLKTHCVDTFRIILISAILDVVVDLGILTLPMPYVFKLHLPLRRKLAIGGTLLVGAMAIAFGIVRLAIFIDSLARPILTFPTAAGLRTDDANGIVSALCIWYMLEVGVAMVAICLPTLSPLFRARHIESILRSYHRLMSIRSNSSSLETGRSSTTDPIASQESKEQYLTSTRGSGLSTTTAMYDPERVSIPYGEGNETLERPRDRIMVEKTFQLTTASRPNNDHV